MKYFVVAAFSLLLITSCKESDDSSAKTIPIENTLLPTEDTFQRVDLFKSPMYIQTGSAVDSASFRAWGSKVSLYYRLPAISKKEFPAAAKWINQVFTERQNSYKELQKEPGDEVFDEFLGTKLFYKDNKILSIVLDEWITDGMHRSVWEHHSFNYDIVKAKEISIADYFTLQSASDTNYINNFLRRSIGIQSDKGFDIRKFEDMRDLNVSFAADGSNVYFFFDRYGLFGIGDRITIVPKKYISEHIKPEYR